MKQSFISLMKDLTMCSYLYKEKEKCRCMFHVIQVIDIKACLRRSTGYAVPDMFYHTCKAYRSYPFATKL